MGLEKKMLSESQNTTADLSGRRKRPERQLYVPPAQRRLAPPKGTENETKQTKQHKHILSNRKVSKIAATPISIDSNTEKSVCEIKQKKLCDVLVEEDKKVLSEAINLSAEKSDNKYENHIPSLIELIKLDLLSLPTYNTAFLKNNIPSLYSFHECSCEFHQYLTTRYKNDLKLRIQIFHINDNQICLFSHDELSRQTFLPYESISFTVTSDITLVHSDWKQHFNTNLTMNQAKLCSKIRMRYSNRSQILQSDVSDSSEVDVIFNENCAISENELVCDSELFENIVDLTEFDLGHYFWIKLTEGEHFYACSQKHNVKICVSNHFITISINFIITSEFFLEACFFLLNYSLKFINFCIISFLFGHFLMKLHL